MSHTVWTAILPFVALITLIIFYHFIIHPFYQNSSTLNDVHAADCVHVKYGEGKLLHILFGILTL